MQLFISPNCPRCPEIKKLVKENYPDCELIDSTTDEGYFLAIQNNIMSVPVLIFNGKKYSVEDIYSLISTSKKSG